jgi:ABC-type uncharacterized transport system ATPase subunit
MLEMRGICKRFGTVLANDYVDLVLYPGDILGLLGENGAGKTTLMNNLFGVYSPDAGEIRIDGAPVRIRSSADALALGVGMVHQHFHLVACHSVLENLMAGRKGRGWRLDRDSVRRRMRHVEERYGLSLPSDALAGDLTIGEQQRLEIIKALVRGARVLVLDEPTSTLTPQETEGLFVALRAMAVAGMGVVFISHKLNEVRAITNRLMIMRQGRVTAALANDASVTRRRLAELMCDCDIDPPAKPPGSPGAVLLALEGICTAGGHRPRLDRVSLDVHAGEILGIAGVSGNGQRELADVVAGILAPTAGRLIVDGHELSGVSPRRVQRLGIGRIPEDRMGTGLITSLPLSASMVLPRFYENCFSRFGLLKHRAMTRFVEEQIAAFDIRAKGPEVRTGNLSGGNLQKALLARELAWDPLVLLAAQPTRGLDVSAAQFVHQQFLRLRADARGLLLISEDLEELFALSDRIAVMFEGRVMAVLPIAEATVRKVGLLMAGVAEAA